MADNGTLDGKKIVGTLTDELQAANQEALSLLATFNNIIASAQNFKTPSQGNSVTSQGNTVYKNTNALLKERERLLKAVERQQARNKLVESDLSKTLAKERLETQRLNRENKERAILQNRQLGAYRKLNLERSKASKTLRDLIASEKASNEEIQKAQANFDKLDAKVRKADAAVRDSTKNVGNYKSAFAGIGSTIRGLIGAFGLVEGIRFGATLVKDSIALAREAKGVEFAFERLGDAGVDAFERVKASTRGLISDVAIKTALVDFDNFNISLEETDTLFEFLAVRAAQTGKSIDSLRDSLVEGLSKESKLRIDNLGISAAELNAELEKTPDFVQAVANIAKREVAEAGDILDEAANGAERFAASFENIQVNIGKAFSTSGGFGLVNDFLDAYNVSLEIGNAYLNDQVSYLDQLQAQYRIFTKAGREANLALLEEIQARQDAAKAIDEQVDAYVRLNGSLAPLVKGQQEAQSNGGFSLFVEEDKRLLADINAEIEKYNEQLSNGLFSTREEAKVIQDKIAALEKEREAILGSEKARKEKNDAIIGTIGYYTELINKEKEVQKNEVTTRAEFQESQDKIDEYTEKIRALTGEFLKLQKVDVQKALGLDTSNIDFTEIAKGYADAFNAAGIKVDAEFAASAIDIPSGEEYQNLADQATYAYERAANAAELSGEKQRRILRQTLFGAQEIYGIDLNGFIDILDKKEAALEDYAESSRETLLSLNTSILEGTLNRLEEERDAEQRKLDLILADKTASDKKKEQAEAEYRKKDLEIRKKQFKAEQKAAIARTVINTAVAIIQAYAQLGPIGGTIAGVLISALGSVQLAQIKKQKPPEFFKGKKATDNFEGIGSVNERPGQREIGVDEKGNVSLFPAGKHYRHIKRNDLIIPSMKEFDTQIKDPTSDLFKRVNKKYGQDAERRTAMFMVQPAPMDIEPMRKMFAKELSKYANRPIHNHVHIKNQRKRLNGF